MSVEKEEKIDYLEVDDSIPGQNYVCLSFVSPESMIESKEAFAVSKFLQSVCKDKDMDFKRTMEQYKDFCYKFGDDIQKDFDEQNNFKTSIRGLKVRGTYNTREEADRRAKKLQTLDSDFNVFVGQVGYWLPWDPCADKIEDEHFINSQLNDMMEKYKENTINKDLFYEEQKREKVKAAREEVLAAKKKQMEEDKQKELEDSKEEKQIEDSEKVVESTETEVISENVGNDETTCNLDSDLKKSLEDVDPWIASKLQQSSVPSPESEVESSPEPEVESSPEPEVESSPEPHPVFESGTTSETTSECKE
jgi:uncharacterized phage infection (PIP) family protein YhgE